MTITCDACGCEAESHSDEVSIYNGWELPVDQFGYYAGFSDNIDVLIGIKENAWLKMCHDCVLKFLETFPLLAEKITCLGHSMRHENHDDPLSTKSCCKYAWTFVKNGEKYHIYDGDGEGGWVFNRTSQ